LDHQFQTFATQAATIDVIASISSPATSHGLGAAFVILVVDDESEHASRARREDACAGEELLSPAIEENDSMHLASFDNLALSQHSPTSCNGCAATRGEEIRHFERM
jgi:hypothetical protein